MVHNSILSLPFQTVPPPLPCLLPYCIQDWVSPGLFQTWNLFSRSCRPQGPLFYSDMIYSFRVQRQPLEGSYSSLGFKGPFWGGVFQWWPYWGWPELRGRLSSGEVDGQLYHRPLIASLPGTSRISRQMLLPVISITSLLGFEVFHWHCFLRPS